MFRFARALTVVCATAALCACSSGGGSGVDSGPEQPGFDAGGPITGQVGAPCTRNADCNSLLCLASGVCTRACTSQASCPSAWNCDAVPNAGTLCVCEKSADTTELCDGRDNDCDGVVDEGATCGNGLVCQGGACSCPPERTCGSDAGVCIELQSDPNNCGACGTRCGANQACQSGACATNCVSPPTNCGGACVDTQTDSANCGACGNACTGGKRCTNGTCGCAAPSRDCGGACVDVQSSGTNCGACGTVCGGGRTCVNGACACAGGTTLCGQACVDLQTNNATCGSCGNACGAGSSCSGGTCTASCGAGQTRCNGACTSTMTDRNNCGACGTACAANQTCSAGACVSPTVNPGATCVNDSDCGSGGRCRAASSGFPGGYCYYNATAFACPTTCPTGSACSLTAMSPMLVANLGLSYACFKSCTANNQCRAGYVCNTSTPGKGVCMPDCNAPASSSVCRPDGCGALNGWCQTTCSSASQCSATSSCDAANQFCFCTAGSTCSSNSACNTGTGLCGCSNNSYCPADRTCDLASGECR